MSAPITSLAIALAAVAATAALFRPASVAAEPYRRAPDMLVVPPAPQGVGCYWYRGREFCGRYCYWEANGKRYCREREREAVSQVPATEAEGRPFVGPMKLGAGGAALRSVPRTSQQSGHRRVGD